MFFGLFEYTVKKKNIDQLLLTKIYSKENEIFRIEIIYALPIKGKQVNVSYNN